MSKYRENRTGRQLLTAMLVAGMAMPAVTTAGGIRPETAVVLESLAAAKTVAGVRQYSKEEKKLISSAVRKSKAAVKKSRSAVKKAESYLEALYKCNADAELIRQGEEALAATRHAAEVPEQAYVVSLNVQSGANRHLYRAPQFSDKKIEKARAAMLRRMSEGKELKTNVKALNRAASRLHQASRETSESLELSSAALTDLKNAHVPEGSLLIAGSGESAPSVSLAGVDRDKVIGRIGVGSDQNGLPRQGVQSQTVGMPSSLTAAAGDAAAAVRRSHESALKGMSDYKTGRRQVVAASGQSVAAGKTVSVAKVREAVVRGEQMQREAETVLRAAEADLAALKNKPDATAEVIAAAEQIVDNARKSADSIRRATEKARRAESQASAPAMSEAVCSVEAAVASVSASKESAVRLSEALGTPGSAAVLETLKDANASAAEHIATAETVVSGTPAAPVVVSRVDRSRVSSPVRDAIARGETALREAEQTVKRAQKNLATLKKDKAPADVIAAAETTLQNARGSLEAVRNATELARKAGNGSVSVPATDIVRVVDVAVESVDAAKAASTHVSAVAEAPHSETLLQTLVDSNAEATAKTALSNETNEAAGNAARSKVSFSRTGLNIVGRIDADGMSDGNIIVTEAPEDGQSVTARRNAAARADIAALKAEESLAQAERSLTELKKSGAPAEAIRKSEEAVESIRKVAEATRKSAGIAKSSVSSGAGYSDVDVAEVAASAEAAAREADASAHSLARLAADPGSANAMHAVSNAGEKVEKATGAAVEAADRTLATANAFSVNSEKGASGAITSSSSSVTKGGSTVALRTNLLRWLTATPDAGISFRIGTKWEVMLNVSWTSLKISGGETRYATFQIAPEVRYSFKGHAKSSPYIGVIGKGGQFNYKFGDYGYQGDSYGGGLSGGYVLRLNRSLSLDFGLALGYITAPKTQKYEVINSVHVLRAEEGKNWIGPINAGVTLVWNLGRKK